VFALLKLVASADELKEWDKKYRQGGMGYGEVKKRLAELLVEYFKPYREKRAELEKNIGYVNEVLKKGAERATAVAAKTLKRARKAVGLE
jgi:tryptophanyl-tRNA synthetase